MIVNKFYDILVKKANQRFKGDRHRRRVIG